MALTASSPDPALVVAQLKAYVQLCEELPDEMEIIVGVVAELLAGDVAATRADPWAHLADHIHSIVPPLMADPRITRVSEAMVTKYTALLEASVERFSPAKIGVLGVVVVVVAVAEIIHSCVEGPHPAPGTSAKVSC